MTLNEGRDAPLYHGMAAWRFPELIGDGVLHPNTRQHGIALNSPKHKHGGGLSTTRVYRFAELWASEGLVFQFDQAKLARNYKIIPYNHYSNSPHFTTDNDKPLAARLTAATHQLSNWSYDTMGSEYEEYVLTRVPIPLKQYVTALHICRNAYISDDTLIAQFKKKFPSITVYDHRRVKQTVDEAHIAIKSFRDHVKHINTVDVRDNYAWSGTASDLMKKYGFTKAGEGNYASVFSKPNYPYVIKLFMKDTAYLKWLHFAQQNPHNPYVPKIRGKVIKITEVLYAVRLEALSVMSANQYNVVQDFIDTLIDPEDSLEGFGPDKRPVEDPNLRNILMLLIRNKRLCDLHFGNVMMRGKQPVLIDPFYNYFRGGTFTIDPNDISEFSQLF